MYCEYCGKKMDEDSVFCEHCGKKIEEETKKTETKKIEARKIEKEVVKKRHPAETRILFAIILVVVFGYVFFLELRHFNSPENAMNGIMKDFREQNYQAILENFGIENNEFISSEIFSNVYKDKLDELKIFDYQVVSCDLKTESKANCTVSYKTSKNGITEQKNYDLVLKEEKKFLLFQDWALEETNVKAINDYILYLPKDSQALLLGKELNNYRSSLNDKDGYDAYKIPKLFNGIYPLEITFSNGMKMSKELAVTKESYTYQFAVSDLTEEYKKQLTDLSENLMNTFYQGIINKTKFEELKTNYDINLLKETYDKLGKDILKDTKLTNFQVGKIRLTDLELTESGEFYLTLQMNYDYTLSYFVNEKETIHNGKSNDTFYIIIKNAEMKEITKLESLVTYFSKKY